MIRLFVLQSSKNIEDALGQFFVIENLPDPHFITDKEGEVSSFDTFAAALKEAEDCQEGYVILFP